MYNPPPLVIAAFCSPQPVNSTKDSSSEGFAGPQPFLINRLDQELKQSKQFTQVIDTTVSFSPDIKKIQDDIAGPLGLKFDDCNESDRSKKLWSRLTHGEKILIILDDVWGDIDFDEIGIPQSDNRKGCRVFVTTRNLQVCNKLGCSSTIRLDLLSEDDAWIMFQRYSGLRKVSTKNLLDRGRKIANECKRVPIAIAAIASSLKGEQRREKWDVALSSLQKHMSVDGVDNDLAYIYKCLKFSYDYLKNKNAEELFLLSSVFQEDEEISTEILTRLCVGVGLFGESYEKYNNARNLVVVAKDKLLDSCLLLKTYKGGVKMHDLIREVAQWIANKEILVVDFSNKNQKSVVGRDNNIKYLSFHGNPMDLCSTGFDGSKLLILIFNMWRCSFEDVPVSFFKNIAGLRVLNLIAKRIWPQNLSFELPQSIRLLTNIRSLLVESVDLGDISVLESLQSLETLDLKDCKIDKIPEEIAQLRELRLLNLEDCTIESNNPFEVIQKCPSLEELYFRNSFNDFCKNITLPTLERYHLIEGYSVIYDSSLSKCMSLRTDHLSEATFKQVMQTAEHLNLQSIKKEWRNIMPEIVPIDEGMNDLIELHLDFCSQLQCLVDTEHIGSSQVPNVFSKLVVLKLERIDNLKELCNGPISFDSINNLEELTIEGCWNLRSLFKGNVNLCNLKTVKIERCPKLVSVFHLSPSGSLPLLEELNISECEQLENIITYERKVDDTIEDILLPKLKLVKIERCGKLTYIFDQEVKLDSLIELELESVSNFIDIFPKSDHSISKPREFQLQVVEPIKSNIFSCCYRSKTTKVPSQACSISTITPQETSSYCFSSIWERAQCLSKIKVIKLELVSKIKSVFTLSIASKMLLLETLTIAHCDELEHIVVDIGDGSGGNELGNVFPKLTELIVHSCEKLEYILGRINTSDDDHDQNNNEIQLHLPALESLKLVELQSLISMCPTQYHTTFPLLKKLEVRKCSQVDVKSIGDFTFLTSISRYLGSTTIKQFNGNMEHFLALERLEVSDFNVESILCLNEESEREIHLGLQLIRLIELHTMISLFVGPKNTFALKNLKRITIYQCEKLEIVFSTSVSRCLSQLSILIIQECNELKHIIEEDDDDIENAMSSKTCCFPVLKTLVVVKCNKLKSVFSMSMSKELPKLEVMSIRDADELEEIFKSLGDDHKVEIPTLKLVAFVNLPSLCHVQGIQFQTVEYHFIQNCKKLSLTSLTSSRVVFPNKFLERICRDTDAETYYTLLRLFREFKENPQKEMNRTPKADHENVPDLKIPSVATLPTNSKELISEQSTSQQHSLGQIDTTIKLSEGDSLEDSMSAIPETKNVPPVHLVDLKQKGIQVSIEEGTASTSHANTITSSTDHLESPVSATECLNIEFDVNLGGSQQTTQTNSQVSLNDDALMQVSSTIEQQFPKDDEIIVSGLGIPSVGNSPTNSQLEDSTTSETNEAANLSSISETKNEPHVELGGPKQKGIEGGAILTNAKTITSSTHLALASSSQEQDVDVRDSQKTTKTNNDQDDPSPTNVLPLPFTFQTHSTPFQGNHSQKVEDSSSPSLITCELEQLVSKKVLAIENMSLLTDFLVKHPSVLLRDTSLSNRYKGYAYNCLAELLKFLQTHSVLDVLGSSHSEFVELLQDVRKCGFDKDWLDGVEKHALFPDLHFSQDAFQKLLDSEQHVTKEVEAINLKLNIFSQHVEDLKHQLTSSEAVLESIIQQKAQVLETKAALSAPLGY